MKSPHRRSDFTHRRRISHREAVFHPPERVDSNAALQQKSAFFDAHVAFVENDGTEYYHNYSCSYFKKQSYWAYSVNLAIARGYTACPYCGG